MGSTNGLRNVIKSKRVICGSLWQVMVVHLSSLSLAHQALASRCVGWTGVGITVVGKAEVFWSPAKGGFAYPFGCGIAG